MARLMLETLLLPDRTVGNFSPSNDPKTHTNRLSEALSFLIFSLVKHLQHSRKKELYR